jgi:hypothetical protein
LVPGSDGRFVTTSISRYSESLPFTRAHDGFGASLGANLNRYLSAELSFDHYDLHLDLPGVGKVSELGTAFIMPQIRLRYPFLDDKLEPYLTAGVGVAFSQVNDALFVRPDVPSSPTRLPSLAGSVAASTTPGPTTSRSGSPGST